MSPHRRAALAALGLAFACAGAKEPAESEPAYGERGAPRPVGVVVDPPTQLPEPRTVGRAERRLLTLSPAADPRPAVAVVDRFFRAVAEEREDQLADLFDPSGRMWSGRHRRQISLVTAWSRRLASLDYTTLAGSHAFRPRDREVYLANDALKLSKERHLPMMPREDEVLVRIRMSPVAVGGTRLFGDEMVFLLRRTASGYKIAQMREDFRLP